MKKALYIFLFIACSAQVQAQEEGRLGIFTGVYNSSLMNANDFHYGDFLPSYKGMIGLEGGYFVTALRTIPLGITANIGYWGNGQNYKGAYFDSSQYEAFTRMRYVRGGVALHTGTNIRRKVAFRIYGGMSVGFLNDFSDRYEHYRANGDTYLLEIENQDIVEKDTFATYGRLNESYYEKLDYGVFFGGAFDIKVKHNIIFSIGSRYDMGLAQVENENQLTATFQSPNGDGTTYLRDIPAVPSAIKYNGPTIPELNRDVTNNVMWGVFAGLSYRLYNTDKVEMWYKP